MKLLNSKTYYNLAKSYAGECQAHVRYKFIEYGARKEGYVALAEIIDKIVYTQRPHRIHLGILQRIRMGI